MAVELKGRTIYEFQGDEEQGELSFPVGADVIVRRQDIGDGWWEGEVNGRCGLFPATYVELSEHQGGGGGGGEQDYGSDDDWDDGDDWDEHEGEAAPSYETATAASSNPFAAPPKQQQQMQQPQQHYSPHGSSADQFGKAETMKRSVNRFSAFVKAGAEGFMIGAVKDVTISPSSTIHVVQTADGLAWAPNPEPYNQLMVKKAGTRSKFKGMKSYEAFEIEGAGAHGTVERRFKHFTWLYERLRDKYSCMCVIPLPDKSYNGKYGENFLDKRQQKLEQWLNRICRHPVLARDTLSLQHFLTCPTSDPKTWKLGKRKAEKDDFVAATFFRLVSQDVACPRDSDKDIDSFNAFLKEMDKSVKKNMDIASAHADRMSSGFKREFKKIASGISSLGQTFSQNGGQVNGDSVKLSMALANCGNIIEQIADMWAEQPKHQFLPWHDGLREYATMVNQFNDAITSSKSATQKVIELDDNETTPPAEKEAVRARRDIIHTLTLCEMAHFHQQRRTDFKDMMVAYLNACIKFHRDIADKYELAKVEFDRLHC